MLNPYELLSTLNLNGLCAEEWWFCHCLFISKKETEVFNKEWLAYMQATKTKINFSKIIKSLSDKEFIINLNKGDELLVEKIITTDKFQKIVEIDIDQAFNEVLEVYPNYLQITGQQSKKVLAKTGNLDELKIYYFKFVIKSSRFEHERFISLTEMYHENKKYADMGLDRWLKSWSAISKSIETENGSNVTIEF